MLPNAFDRRCRDVVTQVMWRNLMRHAASGEVAMADAPDTGSHGDSGVHLIALGALSIVILLGFNGYALMHNSSGHTGADPYWLYAFFLPNAALAAHAIGTSGRAQRRRRAAWALLWLQLAGMVNVYGFDAYGVLMTYEEAARRGRL